MINLIVDNCTINTKTSDAANLNPPDYNDDDATKLPSLPNISLSPTNEISIPLSSQISSSLPSQSSIPKTPQKSRKRIWQPTHLKQVTMEHLSSPTKRKKYWSKAIDELNAIKKKVKVLQEDKRRMAKKIVTLNSMLEHLKDQKLLSENASDTIMVE